MLRSPERVLCAALSLLLLAMVTVPALGNQDPDLDEGLNCQRRFTGGGSDCGTVTDICRLAVNNQTLPQPDNK